MSADSSNAGIDFSSLTRVDLARAHGISDRTVKRWHDLGMPRNADGTYSLPATIEWRCVAYDNSLCTVTADRAWHWNR